MTELLDRLQQDHWNLSHVLLVFDSLLDRFHEGAEPDYELMSEMLKYLERYADQIHHPSEEDIFERLRARSNESLPVLDLLSKQHELIGQLNRRFRQSLEGIMHEAVLRRDEVEAQGRELVKTLREHLNVEEEEAFPMARERLSERDWDELRENLPSLNDPMFSDAAHARFRSLLKHLMDQAEVV